ncbi:uncharacterized protein LOC135484826 [Lineus longissimus]|uniref:uncharacterized protein LOC135484826 n=1 Tax=Lineus longissimus TaxID=88925 RepID=UPI00315D050E
MRVEMECFTEYLQVSRYKIIQIDLQIPICEDEAKERRKTWFGEEHLQELLTLLRDVIWERLETVAVGGKQTRKKSCERNKSGKLTGKLIIAEYKFKLKKIRQSCIIPSQGGKYKGCGLEKEKLAVTVEQIPHKLSKEPVPSSSGYFRSEDKDEGDSSGHGEEDNRKKKQLKNIISKSGKQISKRSKTGRPQKKERTAACDEESDDDEGNQGSLRQWISSWRTPKKKHRSRSPRQTEPSRSNRDGSRSKEGQSGSDESEMAKGRLESRSNSVVSEESVYREYRSNNAADSEKIRTPPKKRKMRMADFILHPGTVQDDDDVEVDKVSNDGAAESEAVKKKRRPDLSRFGSNFRKGCKMKKFAQNNQDFSDEGESVNGTCSEVDENGSGDEVDGFREGEKDVGVVEMECRGSGEIFLNKQDFGVKDCKNANDLQNSEVEHHEDIGAQDTVKSETSQNENLDDCPSNIQPHPSQVDCSVITLSGETNPTLKKLSDSKHGKSLIPGASDGSSLRQRKKCTVMPVKPLTVMTAIQQGKVVEITKKESKVCLSYVDNDGGERGKGAADEKKGPKTKCDLGENSNQEVVKFCQALKSKKKLLTGQSKSEHPPFIELDEEFWEKDLNRNDFGSSEQTLPVGKQVCKDEDESDSGDDLPNMEAIISQSSNSQNSNCSGEGGLGSVSPLKSPNAGKESGELPSIISDKSVSCGEGIKARAGSESQKCYVGIGRRRRLVNSSKDSKSKKDQESDPKEKKDADTVLKKKRPKSKERVGIFEKLSPARAGGVFANDYSDLRSQGVQTDAVQRKIDKEETSYEIELKRLGGNDFNEIEMEDNDVELKSLACAGPNDLGVAIGPRMISPGICDQRSTGAKSVVGDCSGSDGDGEVVLKKEGESLEPEPTETSHDKGSESEVEKRINGLGDSPSRSKRFKGSYLEYDSDMATKGNKKMEKTKSNRCDPDNDYSDSSAVPDVGDPPRKVSKRPRRNLSKITSKSCGTGQARDKNDDQYCSSSSLHSKTDLASDFSGIPIGSRKKTLSTSTCSSSTVLESYGFLAAKRPNLDEDSSSSHQDWETFSVQSNTEYTSIIELDNENQMMLDSGFNSSANTTIASLNHAEQPDNLPTIVPAKKKNKLKSSPWRVKLKTGKESKAVQRKKRLTKKVKSPRSPRGLGKIQQTSSLQTFSSSKEREAVSDHEELPDLLPAFGGIPSQDNGVMNGAEAVDVSTSLSETQKVKRRKVTKSVCQKKKDDSDTEVEVSKPSKKEALSKEKGTKCHRRKLDGSLGARKSRAICKKDKPPAAHLMSSSDDETRLDFKEISDGSVAKNIDLGRLDAEAHTSRAVLESGAAATGKMATNSYSDDDSDKTLPAVLRKSDDESVWKDTKVTSKAKMRRNRERRKHVLPSLVDEDMESASNGEVPAQGLGPRRSGSTSSVSSTELPSVSFVSEIRKRLSLCPVVDDDMVVIIEELSTPVMIKVEHEVADEIDKEIQSIHDVSKLSDSHLQYLVTKYEKYLQEIFQGKSRSWRHEDYKRGGKDRQNLTYNIHTLRYREEQEDTVMESLMKIFCSKHQKYLDYVFKVMFPEMLIKIYMEVRSCSMEKAEADLEDVVVDDIVCEISV